MPWVEAMPITYHQSHSKPVISYHLTPLSCGFDCIHRSQPILYFLSPTNTLAWKKFTWQIYGVFFSVLGLQTSKTMWISNATGSFWLQFSYLEERKQSRRHLAVCNNKTEIGKRLNVWIVRPAFPRKIQELSKQYLSPEALRSLWSGKGPGCTLASGLPWASLLHSAAHPSLRRMWPAGQAQGRTASSHSGVL